MRLSSRPAQMYVDSYNIDRRVFDPHRWVGSRPRIHSMRVINVPEFARCDHDGVGYHESSNDKR